MDSYEEENYCSTCHRWYKDFHDCSEDRFEQQADDMRARERESNE